MKSMIGALLISSSLFSPLCSEEPVPREFSAFEALPLVDTKNVMASLGNLVVVRTFDKGLFTDINSAHSYIEAYDIYTGERLWTHKNSGMIVSYLIVNSATLLLRTYGRLTAIDLYTGRILWVRETVGAYSTVVGE